MSYDTRFVKDDNSTTRPVEYKCAGCGKSYKQEIRQGAAPEICHPPGGVIMVQVEVCARPPERQDIVVPVCNNDECIAKGLRSAFELLMLAKQ